MGILNALEQFLRLKPAPERVDLKEIVCNVRKQNPIKQFRTAAVGTEYKNVDGSERQDALKKIKAGDAVRLIWEEGKTDAKDTIYLVRKGRGKELSMADCFGRLNDKVDVLFAAHRKAEHWRCEAYAAMVILG